MEYILAKLQEDGRPGELDGPLRRSHLPEAPRIIERLKQAVSLGLREDLGRWMHEDLELAPRHSQRKIAGRQHRTRPPCLPGKAHHKDLSSVLDCDPGEHRH